MVLVGSLRTFARLYPYEVEVGQQLQESLSFLDTDLAPEIVVRGGYGAGLLSLVFVVPLLATGLGFPVALLLTVTIAVLLIHSIHSFPNLLAAFRRTEALGSVPNLIGRAVLRMQIQPATESAVRFAAETGYGPLSENLSAHIDRSMGTPRTGIISFAEEWAEWFPAVRRSAHLLVMAQDAPEAERRRTLDRTLMSILDGTRNQMADFTASIRGPTTALYAFGVMIPLALVALVPAATLVGYPVPILFFIVTYNVVLPIVLIAASLWLLVRRPVAFPPPKVTREHPDVPDRLWIRLVWAPIVGAPAFVLTLLWGPSHLAILAGVGFGLGGVLIALFRPIILVRNHVRAVEEHLVDALYLVGRQVSEGEAVESVIQQAGDRVPGETGVVFERAAGLQRRLHVGVEEAFMGEYGALRDIPSPRAHSTAGLLAIASREGKPAGRAIVSMADHLEELQEVDEEAKRQLANVTGTLDHTASYFGPLVAGATVGLADIIVSQDVDLSETQAAASTLPSDQLGIVVGVFVITLCFILVPLSVMLRHGLDRALLGYRVGRSLLSAIPLYVITIVCVTMIG